MSQIIDLDAEGGEDPDIAFADVPEVMVRMGLESFTTAQTAQVKMLLAQAASAILDEVGWSDAAARASIAEAVPRAFRTASIEAVTRVMQNPRGVRSQTEALGDHSRAETFTDASAGVELTATEIKNVCRAADRPTSGSVRVPGLPDLAATYLPSPRTVCLPVSEDETP